MTFYFPDSGTGYYEDERSFYDHDRELELAAQNREDRFEAEAEEMLERLWEGPILPYVDASPTAVVGHDDVDAETGCTAAEMKEKIERAPACRTTESGSNGAGREGRVA